MTSKRAAKSLTNCYILVSEFDWNSRCIDACGVIVEIPIDIRPYREVWHYLGIVLSEVKWVKLQDRLWNGECIRVTHESQRQIWHDELEIYVGAGYRQVKHMPAMIGYHLVKSIGGAEMHWANENLNNKFDTYEGWDSEGLYGIFMG
ncbi:hypothetical protein FIBSPDRAFT_893393 [Athelia psychrophila]|uniref:Uncharacterized protein n=1 Tax=Athelia psychrophila TaxID=1759441 RepID=A0A166H8V5_9AGAM|nr:hypothetical protein FIBSPDRAFT_893393 [Fibularhizoctonia sp. CBS 109695]